MYDNLLKDFETKLNNQLLTIDSMLKSIKQVTKGDSEEANTKFAPDIPDELNKELETAQKTYVNAITKIKDCGYAIASSIVGIDTMYSKGVSVGVYTTNQPFDFDSDKFISALEPFTNAKRLELIKVLANESLTSGEISKRTGLLGGQLYHHLSSLETAGFLDKNEEKYQMKGEAITAFMALISAVSGTELSKN